MGILVTDDYRGLAQWTGPLLVTCVDGKQYRVPAGVAIALHEHLICWSWPGDEPGGVVLSHAYWASVEQIPADEAGLAGLFPDDVKRQAARRKAG